MISYLPIEAVADVPLEAARWRMLLAELIDEIACSGRAEEVSRLREGFVLLARAPALLRAAIAPLPLPDTFATWLATGALETAALALIGRGTGYMVSRSGEGRHIATLVLPASDAEHSADAATFALSVLAALAEALLAQSAAKPRLVSSGAERLLH